MRDIDFIRAFKITRSWLATRIGHTPVAHRFGVLGTVALLTLGITIGSFIALIDKPMSSASATSTQTSSQRSTILTPRVWFTVPWGAGKHSVGRLDGNEGASFGPMSFAIGLDGTVWLLDQQQRRLAQFNALGNWVSEIRIPSDTYFGLEITRDGSFVIMDKLVRREIMVLDANGNIKSTASLKEPGMPESGYITNLFAFDDGIWVEYDNTYRNKVMDSQYRPCQIETVRGRPVAPGIDLMGALDNRGGAMVWLEDRTGRQQTVTQKVTADYPIGRIVTLQADNRGHIHAIFHLMEFDRYDVARLLHEEVYGIVYNRDLKPLISWHSPWALTEWMQFSEVKVGADGTVYQMWFDDKGVSFGRGKWVSE